MPTLAGAPKLANLNEFRSVLAAGNDVAKAARFAVQINKVGVPSDLHFLCEAAEFPARALNAQSYRYYGPDFKLPHQTAYTDLNLTFICRTKMEEKKFFDKWMEEINPRDSYNFNFRSAYACDVVIYQYAETGEATYMNTFLDAFPINVNAMPTSWAEDNYQRLQVTFAFTEWK